MAKVSDLPEGIRAPNKPLEDPIRVLKALASTVRVTCPDESNYHLMQDPVLPRPRIREALMSKAAGRSAARLAMNQYFPQDIISLATETPRINELLPIYRPDDILSSVEAGEMDASSGMNICIDLLAVKECWELYEKHKDNAWDSETMHRLLELFCRSNGGLGGEAYFFNYPVGNYNMRPFPENIFLSLESEETQQPTWTTGDKNLAESFFSLRQKDLSTARGYSAMIRGAARFKNVQRSMELFEQAKKVRRELPLEMYHDLFPALASSDSFEKYFDTLNYVIKSMIKDSNLVPNVRTFEAIARSLALAAVRSSNDTSKHISYLLALKQEMENKNMEPTLGFLSNLFLALNQSPNKNPFDSRKLLETTVQSLEQKWTSLNNSPGYADDLTDDDRSFMKNAMLLAAAHQDLQTAERLLDMVSRKQDRRYLFLDGYMNQYFYRTYAYLIIRNSNFASCLNVLPQEVKENPKIAGQFLLERIHDVYMQNRTIFLHNTSLMLTLLSLYSKFSNDPVAFFDQNFVKEISNNDPYQWKQVRLNLMLESITKLAEVTLHIITEYKFKTNKALYHAIHELVTNREFCL
ncbi:Pentatricopeptide repeat domain 3 [Cichlidogyrus casuarinus]|uniref:Pentatricopeptide repeat domain 3 n=1 Tax=Cichlidogyrus casuarinus TaxID=1844966 RepID=A0ABD2QIN9_9PLAT